MIDKSDTLLHYAGIICGKKQQKIKKSLLKMKETIVKNELD